MSTASEPRRPGVLVWRLLWSMSTGKPVRVIGTGKRKVVNGLVTRIRRDEKLGKVGGSTVVVVMDDGQEIAVNSIEAVVELPTEEAGNG